MEILFAASPALPAGLLLWWGAGRHGELLVVLLVLALGGVGLHPHVGRVGLQGQRGGVVGVGDVLVVVVPAVHVEGEVSAGDIEGAGVVVVGVLVMDAVTAVVLTRSAEVVAAVEELVALVEWRDFNVHMSISVVSQARVLNHWSHCLLRTVYHGNNDPTSVYFQ